MNETTWHMDCPAVIALLPDLHGQAFEPVIASLCSRRPDLIAIAGDVLYGSYPTDNRSPLATQEQVLPFLSACAGAAPSFFSLGNHEWMLDEEDLDLIRSTGVTVLDNEWTEWHGLIIGGLTSGHVTRHRQFLNRMDPVLRAGKRYPARERQSGFARLAGGEKKNAPQPDTAWLKDYAAVKGYHILLSHHPEYFDLIPPSVELILSGHAHGGQWRLGGHGVFAPGQGWWPKLTSGVHGGRLVISRGLSNTSSIPRLFNPTEVVYID